MDFNFIEKLPLSGFLHACLWFSVALIVALGAISITAISALANADPLIRPSLATLLAFAFQAIWLTAIFVVGLIVAEFVWKYVEFDKSKDGEDQRGRGWHGFVMVIIILFVLAAFGSLASSIKDLLRDWPIDLIEVSKKIGEISLEQTGQELRSSGEP